jgi:Transglycosylase SLT domain
MALPKSTIKILNSISKKLDANPKHLKNLIQFESGWNPTIKNPHPKSSARGLIQFINRTARGLGYSDSLDLVNQNSSINAQLKGPVYKYLKQYAPFPTEQSLFMAVFYPKARYWAPNRGFRGEPGWNPSLNPGIDTPQDYMNKVHKKKVILRKFSPVVFLIGVGILLLTIKKKGGKHGKGKSG